jgi:hypothetical protein
LWTDFIFKLYYLLDALLPNELSDTRCIAMQTQIHRHKTLGMLSCHRKSTKIVLIRENMEQFICSNIRAAPPYGINISQLMRYSRACGIYQDFLDRGCVLTQKLMNQGGTRLFWCPGTGWDVSKHWARTDVPAEPSSHRRSSIYGFWLPLWYLQILLKIK